VLQPTDIPSLQRQTRKKASVVNQLCRLWSSGICWPTTPRAAFDSGVSAFGSTCTFWAWVAVSDSLY
jgi:hypothetical protein